MVCWHEREREITPWCGILRLEDVEAGASQSQSRLAQPSETDSDSDISVQ